MEVELYVQNSEVLSAEDTPIAAATWEKWFDGWLNFLQPEIGLAKICEIGLRLTDDAEIQSLNTRFRNQFQPTDVLSFATREVDCPQTNHEHRAPLYLGDIVISVDTAKRQAQQQAHSLATELAWLASHGLLHLLGWDHPDEETETQMLSKQVLLLKTCGIVIDLE